MIFISIFLSSDHLPRKFIRTFAYFAAAFLFMLVSTNSLSSAPLDNSETVVLLHGLGRTAKSMTYMEERLTDAGYAVFNYDYDSRKSEIEYLVDDLQEFIEKCCQINRSCKNDAC